MTRTKMLAAAIALTVTLTAGSATILIPLASAQRPAQNGQPGAAPVEGQSDLPPQNQNYSKPGAAPAAANSFQNRGTWRASTLAQGRWEYKFVPRKSDSLEAFERILNEMGAQGWEYCGSESLLSTNPSRKAQWGTGPTLVFKRPKSGGSAETILPGVSRQGANNSNGGISNSFQNRNAANDPFGGVAEAPRTGDKPAERHEINIIHLQNASADSLAQTLSQLFAGHGKVLSDSRTNSLLIQADKKTAMEMAAIVQKLDVPSAKRDYSPNPSE
jgi:hypothetical protein